MEDEGFVDDDYIEETAWDYTARYGASSLGILRKFAEAAEASGDYIASQTWRAIADVAARILSLG
jgi:hypothetical protein